MSRDIQSSTHLRPGDNLRLTSPIGRRHEMPKLPSRKSRRQRLLRKVRIPVRFRRRGDPSRRPSRRRSLLFHERMAAQKAVDAPELEVHLSLSQLGHADIESALQIAEGEGEALLSEPEVVEGVFFAPGVPDLAGHGVPRDLDLDGDIGRPGRVLRRIRILGPGPLEELPGGIPGRAGM